MSELIKEAEKYLRLNKNVSTVGGLHAKDLISRLLDHIESVTESRDNLNKFVTADEATIEQLKKVKTELAEALGRCVLYTKQFSHLSLGDQDKYRAIANKHKED